MAGLALGSTGAHMVQQQQAITGAEEDVYAGLERGSGLQPEGRPNGQFPNASPQQSAAISADAAQHRGDADAVQHASLQAQLREQHPFKPLTAPLQRHATGHKGQLQNRRSTAALQHQDGSLVQAAQQQTKPDLDEESQLLASLKRLNPQLGFPQQRNNSVSGDVVQPRRPSELQDSEEMSNSAEQQLLQSSLARLDACLSSLTARSGGGQTPRPQATLPSSVSAPITRQPSLFSPPTPLTATPHGLPSRPFSVAAANGQHQGLPTVKGADRRPQAGLQLLELHPSPSVASAPCSGRSGSAVARGITGPHAKAPGAARAALLARSRIPRSPKPEQLPHHQLQQLSQQLQHPSQHAWYPALPGGYQPPWMGMLMQAGLVQQPSVVSVPDAAQPRYAQAPTQLQQFGQDHNQAGRSQCQAYANEAALQGDKRQQPVSVGNQAYEATQSTPSHSIPVHMPIRRTKTPVLQAESSVLSAPVRNQKGIIKAYNLNALMA
ncbi:hypothetical protein WJX82_007316 [Trebouxia sp. C0006]